MIVGCYSLHLYCQYSEEPECPYQYSHEPAEFGAGCETGAKARDSWVVARLERALSIMNGEEAGQ